MTQVFARQFLNRNLNENEILGQVPSLKGQSSDLGSTYNTFELYNLLKRVEMFWLGDSV